MPYAAGDDVAIEFLQVGRGEAKGAAMGKWTISFGLP